MKRSAFFLVALLTVSVFFIAAIAYASDIDRRVAEMQQRIDQGVKSGELTRPEAQQLRLKLNKVRNDEARMKADGRLTKPEQDKLNRELDRLGQQIYREKRDLDRRPR
jgi:septal ring factor EnvC (AmiA/AmiB activator)